MKYQNLHTHTVVSDGQLSYKQTLEVCEKNNIGAVAFTDHDSLLDRKALKILGNYTGPIKWISGIEISSGLPRELGGRPTSGFHIVGLFVDPFNRDLREYCQKMQAARIERMERTVKNLQGLGFQISIDECLRESGGKTVNRPHIVKALNKKRKNLEIIQALKNKMAQKAERDKELKQKYEDMVKLGEAQYPYALFLDSGAYVPGVYVDYLYGLELDKTVEIVRRAGGRTFLAHWSLIKRRIGLDMVEKLLEQNRLDGVEVVWNPAKSKRSAGQEKPSNEILADMEKIGCLADKYSCLRSGGADSHSAQEMADFFQDKALAEKTAGLAEEIIRKSGITLDKAKTSMIG